jgi:serine O-acetyltransferase
MREDIQSVFNRDPAARGTLEILFCYPGLHALWGHRVAHFLWLHHMHFLGRLLSHINRAVTNIEIHPGAKIGRRFFIDHGAGIVIGETAEVGDDVLMYQGAALAGTSLKKEKRHPTIGNNVVIGSHAIVLGAITVGDNARIGAGSVVIKSVPAGATVVGVPGRVVEEKSKETPALDHNKLPDPVAEAIRLVMKDVNKLGERVGKLEIISEITTPIDTLYEERLVIAHEFDSGGGI